MALTRLPSFTLDSTSSFTFANVTVTSNVAAANANLGNTVTANYFVGNGSSVTGVNAASLNGFTSSSFATAAQGSKADTALQPANLTGYATTTDVSNAVANLVNSAPTALDTLKELADALGNDASYSTTVTNALANKLSTTSFTSTADTWLATKTTTNLPEGLNQYYTVAKANSAIDARVTTSFVDNLGANANVANVAYSVAVANVTGIGNIATINKDGNASNILYGNGVFASAPVTYGNSNVSTFLASYGSNTIVTTGNVTVGNIIGNGQALTGLTGANVTGQVGNALVAGTVYTAAQPNITSVGTLTGLTSTGTVNLTGASNVSLGNVANVKISGGSAGYILETDGTGNIQWVDNVPSTTTYNANSIALTGGVYVSGNVTSIQSFGDYAGGNVYVLTDGTGSAPAWQVDIDFISVTSFNRVVLNINYTQASGHTIYVQLYNNSTSTWDAIGTYTGLGAYYAFALEVIDSAPYINGSGVAQLKLYHSNSGNSSHTTSIDYAALELSSQGPQGPRGPTGATGATGQGVAAGGVAGQVLTKNSGTNYDTAWSSSLALAGNIDVDGNTHVGGNLSVTGNLTFTGNGSINQLTGNSGQFYGDAHGVGALYAGLSSGYAVVYNPIIQASADSNAYVQINFQNINHGSQASTDFCATSDNGTDTKFFIDMGIAGGSWDGTQENSIGTAAYADDGYLYVQGNSSAGNLVLGTVTSGTSIRFIAGGPNTANIVGTISSTGANFKNVTTPGNVSATGNVSAAYLSGNGSSLSAITGANVTGQVGNALVAGTVYTAAQPNITSVGTLTSLTATGNITGGNLITAGNIVTGGGSGGNISGANVITANYFVGAGNSLTNLTGANVTGAVAYATTANAVAGANVTGQVGNALVAGTVYTAAQPNITSVGTLTSLTATGNITGGNLITTGNIIGGSGSGGNITGANVISANTLTASGNITAGNILTDHLYYANGVAYSLGGGGATVAGSDTQIQFNDGGSLGGNAGLTFNKTTTTLTANNFVSSTSANLGAVANVHITGGSTNQLLQTDGAGNLTWVTPTGSTVTVDNFTGNGVQTAYTLSVSPSSSAYTLVALGGTIQPRTVYTVSGTTLTFSSAPPDTAPIEVTTFSSVLGFGSGNITANVFSANTVTANTLSGNVISSNTNLTVDTLTANSVVNGGSGTPTLQSNTSIVLSANTVVRVSTSPMQFYTCTSTVRDAIAASNGYVIYNTTTNKLQVYANGSWVDLH
jgi:hypothetical protein